METLHVKSRVPAMTAHGHYLMLHVKVRERERERERCEVVDVRLTLSPRTCMLDTVKISKRILVP